MLELGLTDLLCAGSAARRAGATAGVAAELAFAANRRATRYRRRRKPTGAVANGRTDVARSAAGGPIADSVFRGAVHGSRTLAARRTGLGYDHAVRGRTASLCRLVAVGNPTAARQKKQHTEVRPNSNSMLHVGLLVDDAPAEGAAGRSESKRHTKAGSGWDRAKGAVFATAIAAARKLGVSGSKPALPTSGCMRPRRAVSERCWRSLPELSVTDAHGGFFEKDGQ